MQVTVHYGDTMYAWAVLYLQASKLGLLYPKYVWIAYGWYAQTSWMNADTVNCTEAELRNVLERGISVEVFPIPEDASTETVAGLVSSDTN